MPTLGEIRSQYPQYGDLSDGQLADALYSKFYSDLPRADFNQKLGIKTDAPNVGPDAATDIKNLTPDLPFHAAAATFGGVGDIAKLIGLGGMRFSPPTSAEWRERFQMPEYGRGTAPLYEPTTSEGKYAKAIGENVIGALGPGGVLAKTAQVVVPALLSETGGQAADVYAPEAAPYVRGGLGLTSAVGLARGLGGRGASQAAQAIEQSAKTTPEEIIKSANSQYKSIREGGATIPANEMPLFAAQAKNALSGRFNEANAASVYKTLDKLEAPPAGATFSAGDLLNVRQGLSDAAKETAQVSPGVFRSTPQAAAASIVKSQLDEFVKQRNPALADAISAASNERRLGGVAEALGNKALRAELNASSANSGMNIENAIRQQVKTIVARPDQLKKFTPEVQKMMREIVDGNPTINTLRFVGNLLGGGGGLGMYTTGMLGALAHPAAFLSAPIGLGLKMAGNRIASGKMNAIQEAAVGQSALAQSRQAAIQPQLEAAREAIKNSKMSAARKAAMLQALEARGLQALQPIRAEDNQ